MAVKLHRCSAQWVKIGGHPCWRVEQELIAQGIEYERVPGPAMPWQRKQRTRLHELTGGYLYPAIEFEDGRVYREQSKDMAARIKAGKLFEGDAAPAPSEARTKEMRTPPDTGT
jgi:hypothetical protein